MLAVDVSFLAVPSVNGQNSHSVPVISIYISVFCIVGSMLVSLFLTRQNRQYGQESADKAVSSENCIVYNDQYTTFAGGLPHADDRICFWYKSSRHCTWSSICYAIVGVNTLVIFKSFRYTETRFSCSMVYFMLAFSYLVFAFTSTLTIATTGSACGLVVISALWLIHAARDFHFSVWLPLLVKNWWGKAGQAIRSR